MAKQEVHDWLREYLQQHGKSDCADVRREAKAAGYTRGELRIARLVCGVITRTNRTVEHPKATCWYWELPEDDA